MALNIDSEPPGYGLPEYSPTGATPFYTPEPRPDEERIHITRRFIREESGVFVAQNKAISLALTNQTLDCKEPTYGKGATIRGMVSLAKTESIISVNLKVQGEMEFALDSLVINGGTVVPVWDDTIVLYRKPNQQESKRHAFGKRGSSQQLHSLIPPLFSAEKCPSSMAFAIHLPTFYSHEGLKRPLPPTYYSRFGDGIPGLCVDCHYSLQISVIRKGSLVDKKATLSVPINYLPRCRPARPPLPQSLTFISTLKSTPEEWKLFETHMKYKLDSPSGPSISAGLLLPQSQVYAIGQPIPFHLQLSSSSAMLLSPFTSVTNFTDPPSIKQPLDPKNSLGGASGLIGRRGISVTFGDDTVQPKQQNNLSAKSLFQTIPRIHLSVQRHVTVEVMGQWVQFKECLSRAILHSCPVNTLEESEKDGGSAHIAWEGQLEILEKHKCSGFIGPSIRVRDFIWLSIKPPNPEQSSLQGIHCLIPIRLTTDSYGEELIVGMEQVAHEPPGTITQS
ncbi:hypothetical protein M422DRAFT_24172 [Sphaerobolus stellatus SS14]|nr:hypothetical protein M422DRAFT_24172 [Sphaerobolus stellatus SS14]